MNHSYLASALVGVLQLAVPSYGLRLNRQFGSRQVGWALVVAFAALALLHLAGGIGAAGVRLEWELAGGLVGAAVPVLLLIGLAHVETLFRERARLEREQRLGYRQLVQTLDRRTEELAEAREEYRRELRRRDQERVTLAEGAQQARRELGVQVAAGAARRLNRHLAVIDLYAKLLLAKSTDPRTMQYHERLSAGAAEAGALARQLLACGCSQPLRTQLVSLSDIVQRFQPALSDLLGEQHRLECPFSPNVPLVWADPQLVRVMLEELVRNARDAMSGRGRVRITVERVNVQQPPPGQDPGRHQFISVVVTDGGRGMGREVQQHLGEPFFTTSPGKSSGLGLASVSGLIKAHGGWLAVASAPGHGTCVRLFFPSAVTDPAEA